MKHLQLEFRWTPGYSTQVDLNSSGCHEQSISADSTNTSTFFPRYSSHCDDIHSKITHLGLGLHGQCSQLHPIVEAPKIP